LVDSKREVKGLFDLDAASEDDKRARGYGHTLREILQQPETWIETAALARESGVSLVASTGPVLLTGSGSSHYIGTSLEPILSRSLARPVRAVPAGNLLTEGAGYVPEGAPGTLVSFARSGDSPESRGAVDWFLSHAPAWRHLLVTCNPEGALATRYRDRENVSMVLLPERTNDRSLVMTSSFTNLWLAGRILGGGTPNVSSLSRAAETLFESLDGILVEASSDPLGNVVFLGGGARYGAACEAALKMLEMTDGVVPTFAETFLGLRHGPMCALKESSLLVVFLSTEEPHRSYERDLLAELAEKSVLSRKLLVGKDGDVAFDVGDEDAPLLDVLVGQVLGLFRSLALGLSPDAPSASGVISRVVRGFTIH
jgi:tagatose-6-phosphate ketose/aldose isomerase